MVDASGITGYPHKYQAHTALINFSVNEEKRAA